MDLKIKRRKKNGGERERERGDEVLVAEGDNSIKSQKVAMYIINEHSRGLCNNTPICSAQNKNVPRVLDGI